MLAFSTIQTGNFASKTSLTATDDELREGTAEIGMVDPSVSRINQVRSTAGAIQLARAQDFSDPVPASFDSLDFGPEVRTRDQIFNYLEVNESRPDFDVMGGPEVRTRDPIFGYLEQGLKVSARPDVDVMGGPEVRTRNQVFSSLETPHFSNFFDVEGGPEFRTRLQSPGALGEVVVPVRAYEVSRSYQQ